MISKKQEQLKHDDILDIEEEHCKPHKFVYCGEKGD